MKFERVSLDGCERVKGLAVVIDVLRAFTTAGYLFDAGVEKILLVSGIDEARQLGQRFPGSLLLGEVDGIPIPDFDLGNSPSQLPLERLRGKTIIQRTTAGTQGVVRSIHAQPIFTAALTNAAATARAIQSLNPPKVTFVLTGLLREKNVLGVADDWGDEDAVCADLIEAQLTGQSWSAEDLTRRVQQSRSGRHYDGTRSAFPPPDIALATRIDCFDFAMQVQREDGLHILKTVRV